MSTSRAWGVILVNHAFVVVACGGRVSGPPAGDASFPEVSMPGVSMPEASIPDGDVGLRPPDAGSRPEAGALDARPPPTTPEERAILALKEAGYQRGWTVCECFGMGIGITLDQLDGCARAESGPAERLFRPFGERCALDLARADPALMDYLACQTERATRFAECEKKNCPTVASCDANVCEFLSRGLEQAWNQCLSAYYCGEERHDEYVCNDRFECPDRSDEHACPWARIVCDGGLHIVSALCNGVKDCADGLDESICKPPPEGSGSSPMFDCADGTTAGLGSVCDGALDCSNARDESFCP